MGIDGNNNIGKNNLPDAHLMYGIQIPDDKLRDEKDVKKPKEGNLPDISAMYGIQIVDLDGDNEPLFKFPEEGDIPSVLAAYGIALPNEPEDIDLPTLPNKIPNLSDDQKSELKKLFERIMEILTSNNNTTEKPEEDDK